MSEILELIDAEPGELVGSTARNAIERAFLTKRNVLMRHNDTIVTVRPNDMDMETVERWHEARRPKPRESTYVSGPGPWVTWHSDWSGLAVFPEEINALRYAVEHHVDNVKQMPWGEIR